MFIKQVYFFQVLLCVACVTLEYPFLTNSVPLFRTGSRVALLWFYCYCSRFYTIVADHPDAPRCYSPDFTVHV